MQTMFVVMRIVVVKTFAEVLTKTDTFVQLSCQEQ